jgi:hypothetical protein
LTIDPLEALNVSRLGGQAFWRTPLKRLSMEIPKSIEMQISSSKPRRNRAPFEACSGLFQASADGLQPVGCSEYEERLAVNRMNKELREVG